MFSNHSSSTYTQAKAAAAFVEHSADASAAALAAQALQRWRAEALSARTFALHEQLAAAQAECKDWCSSKQLHDEALEHYLERQPNRQQLRTCMQRLILWTWRQRAQQQLAARVQWCELSEMLLSKQATEEVQQLATTTIAERLRLRRTQPVVGTLCWAMTERKLKAACFCSWREAARVEAVRRKLQQREQQLEAISAGLPAWVNCLGNRRRVERAWLAWRLHVCGRGGRRSSRNAPKQQHRTRLAAGGTEVTPAVVVPVNGGTSRGGSTSREERQMEGVETAWVEASAPASSSAPTVTETPAEAKAADAFDQQQPAIASTSSLLQPLRLADAAAAEPPGIPAPSASDPATYRSTTTTAGGSLSSRTTATRVVHSSSGNASGNASSRSAQNQQQQQQQQPSSSTAQPHHQVAAFGRTLSAGEWQPPPPAASSVAAATLLSSKQHATALHHHQRSTAEGITVGTNTSSCNLDQQHQPSSPQRAAIICRRFAGISESLEAVRTDLTTQTRALFSGGQGAAGSTVSSAGLMHPVHADGNYYTRGTAAVDDGGADGMVQSGPLPLLGAVPAPVTVDRMSAVTEGLHAAANPWLRRTAAEAAADAAATQAVGAVAGYNHSALQYSHARSTAAAAPIPVVVVDARLPTADIPCPSPSTNPLPPVACSPTAAAVYAGSGEQWRVLGQPRLSQLAASAGSPTRQLAGVQQQRPQHGAGAGTKELFTRPGSVPLSTFVGGYW